MVRIQTPVYIVVTNEAKAALGEYVGAAGLAAYREITLAAKGLEIAHLQFVFRRLTLAICSRIRRDGLVEIEMDLGDARLPKSAITAEQLRQAEAGVRAKAGIARQRQRTGAF